MNNLEILQNFSVDISKVIRKHIKDIKKLDPKTQRALGNLIGDFKEGIDNIPSMKSENESESVNEAGVPKMFLKHGAVVKKIRELEDKQKELATPYFKAKEKGDKDAMKAQMELMRKNQKELDGYRKNLASIEAKYIHNSEMPWDK